MGPTWLVVVFWLFTSPIAALIAGFDGIRYIADRVTTYFSGIFHTVKAKL